MNAWTIIAIAVAIGGLVQGSTGVGFALILSPVMALFMPSLLPGGLLLLMLPLGAYVSWRERHAVDWRGVGWITAGRSLGGVAGLVVLMLLPGNSLRVFVGIATLLSALGSMASGIFPLTRSVLAGAGLITGITETATGIGGPPLALVYQHQPGAVLRATLALCFLIGQIISLVLLLIAGRLAMAQADAAVWLMPALAAGVGLSRWSHGRVDGRPMRLAMVGFALVSGVVCLV
jgi:uncharacterized membrane protein YfcA